MQVPSEFVHRHALLLAACPPQAQQSLQEHARRVVNWKPPPAPWGYGEALVRALIEALSAVGPGLLVLPAPDEPDPKARALALAGLEAARRSSDVVCTWLAATAAEGSGEPGLQWMWMLPSAFGHRLPLQWRVGCEDAGERLPTRVPPASDAALVSVIVRSMGRSSLCEALASIVVQTYRPIEVVVVNALGPEHPPRPRHCGDLPVVDAAAAVAGPLRRAAAANCGLDAARGSLLLFLDDDDLLLPDHVARLVHALTADATAVAAYADVALGRHDGDSWVPQHVFSADFDATRLLFENYLPIHSVLFRSAARLRLDENFDLFEDWDFWLQLATCGPFTHVAGVSALYRLSDAGGSEVFSETDVVRSARARLIEKWRALIDPSLYATVLARLQELYREAAQARAQVTLLQSSESGLQNLVRAREMELAAAARYAQSLDEVLQARQTELSNAFCEIDATRQHAAALQLILDRRNADLAAGLKHAAGLQHIIAARDLELSNTRALNDEAQGALQTMLATLQAERDALCGELATLQAELHQLHCERPLQALRRTLKGKKNGPR